MYTDAYDKDLILTPVFYEGLGEPKTKALNTSISELFHNEKEESHDYHQGRCLPLESNSGADPWLEYATFIIQKIWEWNVFAARINHDLIQSFQTVLKKFRRNLNVLIK